MNDYKYEAHKKIPQQILARTGGKTPLTVLDLGCGTPANSPVCMCPRCGVAAPTCELMYPRCGTGLLAFPYAVKCGGLVAAPVALLVIGWCNNYTLKMLVRAKRKVRVCVDAFKV